MRVNFQAYLVQHVLHDLVGHLVYVVVSGPNVRVVDRSADEGHTVVVEAVSDTF